MTFKKFFWWQVVFWAVALLAIPRLVQLLYVLETRNQ